MTGGTQPPNESRGRVPSLHLAGTSEVAAGRMDSRARTLLGRKRCQQWPEGQERRPPDTMRVHVVAKVLQLDAMLPRYLTLGISGGA